MKRTSLKFSARKSTAGKCVAGLVTAGLLTACSSTSSAVPPDGLKVGDDRVSTVAVADRKAPLAIAGTTLDGSTLDLASLRGRVVVLNIWYASCGPCRAEAPALADLATTSKAQGVDFVGIHTSADNLAAAKAFVSTFAIPYPSIDDPDGRVTRVLRDDYRAPPTTFVIDRQGRIAGRIPGEIKVLSLRTLIDRVAAE